jgi:hypothetical protein
LEFDFHDLKIDLDHRRTFTPAGREVDFVYGTAPRIVALAYIVAPPHSRRPRSQNRDAAAALTNAAAEFVVPPYGTL